MRFDFFLSCLFSIMVLTGCYAGNSVTSFFSPSADPGSTHTTPTNQEASEVPLPITQESSPAEARAEEFHTEEVVEANPDEKLTLDAETLADNRVLQGEGQSPPDEPGTIVQHPEPEFDFPVVENDKVRYFIDYYSGRAKKTFALWLERSGQYLPMMRETFADAGLPEDLAYLAMVESGYNEKAYSWAHAVGPWQFIEATGRRYGLHNDWWHDERRDPVKATRAAARFLGELYESFDGDWYLAVASYNAGPGKIRNAIRRYNTTDFWELCRGNYLQTETKNYIPKLLAALIIAKEPEKYGFNDLNYHAPLQFDTSILPSSTDLEVIARLTNSDYQTIKKMNPELKRWCTPPVNEPYMIKLPAGTKRLFEENYAKLPPAARANYARHKVKSGDTLLALSKRYGVRVADIKSLNGIHNARAIQIGTNLIVPMNPDANGAKPLAELKDDYKRSRRSYYTVRNGDSLWKIARKFDVSEKQLRVWNRLGWSNVIRPGQRLIVSSKAAPGKQTASVKPPDGPLRKIVYQVRPGDTFWAISREFSVETRQILIWNNLSDSHILQPGERLTLHVSSNSRG